MTVKNSVRSVLFLTFGMLLVAGMLCAQTLQEAKRLLDQKDYSRALELYTRIARVDGDPHVKKEASYYIGFCKVRLQDFWGAINAYEDFLRQYENWQMTDGDRFIPDTLYVLGRTFEQVNESSKAIEVYRRCVERFPSSEFATKSRDRLNGLGYQPGGDPGHHNPGGDPGHGGHHPPPPPPADPRIIDEIIKMAKAAPTYAQQDEILLSGLQRASNGVDVLKLAKAAATNGVTDEICIRGVNKCTCVMEAVNLAKGTATYAAQDKVCVAGLFTCYSGHDVLSLAQAAATNQVTDQVLKEGVNRCQSAEEVVQLAKATRTYAGQDEICRMGLKICRNGHDVLILGTAAATNQVTDQVFLDGVHLCFNVDEVIALAKATRTYSGQDQICIRGVRTIRTFDEATRLAKATATSGAEQRVLDEARKILIEGPGPGHGGHHPPPPPHYSMQPGVQSQDTMPKPKVAKGDKPVQKTVSVDPFDDLKIDQDRLTRINKYLDSVQGMKDVDSRLTELKPADLSLNAVREATRQYHQRKEFERAHQE